MRRCHHDNTVNIRECRLRLLYVIVWLAMPYSSRHALHNRTQLRPHNIDERCPRHKHHGPAGGVGGLTIVPIIAMRHCQYVSS